MKTFSLPKLARELVDGPAALPADAGAPSAPLSMPVIASAPPPSSCAWGSDTS